MHVFMSTSTFYLNSNKGNQKVAPRLCLVQRCIAGHRKVAPEDVLSPANIKSKADVSPTQLIGLPQEVDLSRRKNEAWEGQLRWAQVHIKIGSDDQRFRIQLLELDVRALRDNKRRLTEDVDEQRLLVRSGRNKATETEKVVPETK